MEKPRGISLLEVISQIPQQDHDAPEAREAEVVLRPPLVAHHQPTEVPEPGEQPLYLPAPLVAPELAPVLGLRLLAVPPVRRDHLYAPLSENRVERVGVVGPIPDQPLGLLAREARREGRLCEGDLVRRSARRVYGERKTRSVCHRHELRTLAPLGLSHRSSPFFAPTKVPPMKHSERSRPPRSFRSSANARRASASTPSWVHRWKRRWGRSGRAGSARAGRARGRRCARSKGCRRARPSDLAKVCLARLPAAAGRESGARALPTARP